MVSDENPLDRTSEVNFDNFMLEITGNGSIDKIELAKQFKLDVDHENREDGLYVFQNKKIIRKPFDISDSTRKINEQINDFPIGFSKAFYADGASSVVYNNPPESIPSGCWCSVDSCGNIGPFGHSLNCSYPNQLSLYLTLKGFVECVYSTDKTYRDNLRENQNLEIREIVNKFIDFVDSKIDENNNETEENNKIINKIYIDAALHVQETNRFKFFNKIPSEDTTDINKILTDIRYDTVRHIPGLNKGKLNYFHGATTLQYFTMVNGSPKKSSIRIYDTAKIAIIPCIFDNKKLYKDMITKLYLKINEVQKSISPKDAFISVANGSFRLIPELMGKGINLDVFYKTFHPVDDLGNPIKENNFMETKEYYTSDGDKKTRRFVSEGENRYAYTITEEGRGKLSMTFIKYENDKPTVYKITTQIYNTGIVQLIFAYKDGDSKDTEKNLNIYTLRGDIYEQIDYQTEIINEYFELIKTFLIKSIDQMFINKLDIYEEKEISKKSDKVFNVIPGVIPYGKKNYMYAGYIVDFFDDKREDWIDNYGWSTNDSERGIIIEKMGKSGKKSNYKIITGKPKLEKIIETPALIGLKFNRGTIEKKKRMRLQKMQLK